MLLSKKNNEAGFNLTELMVVVTIIGILSGVAVPKFQTFKARATQTEAKSGLNGLFLSMQSYQANNDVFPEKGQGTDASDPTTEIGFKVNGKNPKYNYYIHSQKDGWAGSAASKNPLIDAKRDSLRTNARSFLCAPYDAVSKKVAKADGIDCIESSDGKDEFKAKYDDNLDKSE